MMPPKKDTQKAEKGASLEQSTHGQAELVTIDNVEGNGQASGQDQVGSTTEEEGPSLTDMGISDANNASVETDYPDSTIQPKNGQNQVGNGDEHFQVEPDDKNESGTDGNVELEEQPNRQGKPVDSTGQTPLTSTNNDNEKTPNASVQTNTSKSLTDSHPDNTPSQPKTKDKCKKASEPLTGPAGGKKGNARRGGGQNTGHDVTDGSTDNASPQSSVLDSPEMDTDVAQSKSSDKDKEAVCSHLKTVWGLRLDLVLLGIVVVIAAVIVKFPLDAPQVKGYTAIQQQFSVFAEQFKIIENKIKDLKSDVKINSDKHRTQASELNEIKYDIGKIRDILIPFDPEEMLYPDIKTTVGKIRESIDKSNTEIAAVKVNHTALMDEIKRNHSVSISTQENLNFTLTQSMTDIRKYFSRRVYDVEMGAYKLKIYLRKTSSEVYGMITSLGEADIKVSEVKRSAAIAEKMVDEANVKLKIVEKHLFNKDALTAAILILFFLIIGLMLYVLKLKSSLEPALAGGSTSRPLKGSRESEVILQKMPSRPTLDNAVCIISFDVSNSDEYKRIIKETVGQLGEVSLRTHVIRKHADIAELSHCRLYIMCVEFTERHVIIEEQGLGLGDLKLTSYRGVRKLGGSLVILYLHDPGSRNLTDDQLYSDGVYCVKKQQELKELCEIDRFISAHNKLNTAQKKALETAISRVLTIQTTRH